MNHEIVDQICEIIGRVFRSTEDVDCEGGGFMRIRVKLNTTQPLCRGNVITMEDGEQFWALFKYERLLNMCYWCDCLDHTDKDCAIQINSKGTLSDGLKTIWSKPLSISFFLFKKTCCGGAGIYENTKKAQDAGGPMMT